MIPQTPTLYPSPACGGGKGGGFFGNRSCSNKRIERDDDSKKNHPALGLPMRLDPLVKPRSVAIVGATDRISPARSVIESLGALGFDGAIYPVNPKYQTVLNHVCYLSLNDLPQAPDVVVFSIRNPLVPEQL